MTAGTKLGDVTIILGAGIKTVAAGSYVVPTDVVAFTGDGNSVVGGRITQTDLDSGSLQVVDKDAPEISQKCQKGARKRGRRTDEKEPARVTIMSACDAAQQRYSGSGGNPLHCWAAIWMTTQPNVAPMTLPDWCISYLHEIAGGIIAAEGDGDKLAAYIVRQLKFTRSGWSAIKSRASAERAVAAALSYDGYRASGMSTEKAHEEVRQAQGLKDVSSAKRLVYKGHELLRHTPALS